MTASAVATGQPRSWSPLGFLPLEESDLAEHLALSLADETRGSISALGSGDDARLWVRRLTWDSAHFSVPMLRIELVDCGSAPSVDAMSRVLQDLTAELDRSEPVYHVTAEVPADQPPVVQAFGAAGYRLIETRLTYYLPNAAAFRPTERWPVRPAASDDIPDLRMVAATARNPWDRYHADPFFGAEAADDYLATYAEACVGGLADVVLVPADPAGAAPGAFMGLTIESRKGCPLSVGLDHECRLSLSIGRIPLVAVGPDRRGWHVRLLSEATVLFAERGVEVAIMTTQLANRAVIRNCEKLGYRLGRATHVFASWRR